MKSRYLLIAIAYNLICFFENYHIRVVLAIGCCIAFHFLFDHQKSIVFEIAMILLLVFSYPIQSDYFIKGHICSIKNNYVIITNHIQSVIIYGLEDINLDDIVLVNKKVSPITSNHNFEVSTFASYCRGNQIIGTVNKEDVIVMKPAFSIRQKMFQHNQIHNRWANAILFAYGYQIEHDNSYMLLASSMQISFMIYVVRKLLGYFFYPETSLKLTMALTIFAGLLFHLPYGFVRVLITLFAEYLVQDQKDRTAFIIIGLCLYRPYYVKSMAFLLPMGIRLINLFRSHSNHLCITMYIISLQLYFYQICHLFDIIFFPFFRQIAGVLYVVAMIVSFLPISLPFESFITGYFYLLDQVPVFNLVCYVSTFFWLLLVVMIINYNSYARKRFLIAYAAILILIGNRHWITPFYTVNFIDVGQGDCALITTPFNSHGLLIDVGGNLYQDVGKQIVYPYLLRKSIQSVDIIITHQDFDHSGSLESLKQCIKVNEVYQQKTKEIPFEKVQIINPLYDVIYEDDNDNSLISYFQLNRFCFLFMADISANVEKDLIKRFPDLPIDVIKLSHHGSASANSDDLFRNYPMNLAIISVGLKNRYHHPSIEVLQRLQQYELNYLSTAEVGAIELIVLPYLMIYQTSNGQFGVILK